MTPFFRDWSIAFAVLLGLAATSLNASADVIKTLHIGMPDAGLQVNDMHVSFFGEVLTVGGTQANRTGSPSDMFDGVRGVGSNTLNFDAVSRRLSIDNFNVKIKGDPAGSAIASNIVTKVEFTKDGDVIENQTLENGADNTSPELAKTKRFKQRVTGFTNDEAFDFSDLTQSYLRLFNTDPSLNLRYLLSDFKLYKNLSLVDFTLEDFMLDPSEANLLLAIPEFAIEPGETIDFLLGAVDTGTYALATIGTLIVEDVSDGTRFVYSTPQGYAQTVDVDVPEPATLMLVLTGLAVVGLRRRM